MLVLGIQKDHHTSVCAYENDKLIYYCEEERLSKEKKSTELPVHCLNQFIKNYSKKIDMAIITGYDTDGSVATIASYLKYLKLINNIEGQIFAFYKSHHLLHAAKSFYNSGFEKSFVFVVDGRGSSYNLNNGGCAYETSSVYLFENPNNINCLYKRCYTNSEITPNLKLNLNHEHSLHYKIYPISLSEKTKVEIFNNELDLGLFYSQCSLHYNFFKEEGKLMGLSSYGQKNKKMENILNADDFFFKKLGDQYHLCFLNIKKYPELIMNVENEKSLMDLSFLIQEKFENKYFDFITKKFDSKISNNIILTGGTALNVVNNYKLKQKLKNVNLFVEPLCGDEGNSIAACQFFLKFINPNLKFDKFKNLFIGNKYNYNIKIDDNEIISKKINLEEVVNLLLKGKVIALYQGRAEAGPRALGNRSLLLDPRIKNGKDIMNLIKKREKFRPFACSILKEKVHDWFDMAGLEESPFMMYAVNCLKNLDKKIPSVVHVDGTCRVQTITEEYNKILYLLLKIFEEKTNCPLLMNTSFNLAGDPLVETPEDAIDTLKKSKLEYIYFADSEILVYKKKR